MVDVQGSLALAGDLPTPARSPPCRNGLVAPSACRGETTMADRNLATQRHINISIMQSIPRNPVSSNGMALLTPEVFHALDMRARAICGTPIAVRTQQEMGGQLGTCRPEGSGCHRRHREASRQKDGTAVLCRNRPDRNLSSSARARRPRRGGEALPARDRLPRDRGGDR